MFTFSFEYPLLCRPQFRTRVSGLSVIESLTVVSELKSSPTSFWLLPRWLLPGHLVQNAPPSRALFLVLVLMSTWHLCVEGPWEQGLVAFPRQRPRAEDVAGLWEASAGIWLLNGP